jgi:signal transduction histidine kinase
MAAVASPAGDLLDIRRELAELQKELLPLYLVPLLAVPVAWLIYVTKRDWAADLVDVAVLQSAPAVFLILRLRQRHYTTACWLYVLTLLAGISLVVVAHPMPLVMAFGIVVVIIANALLGPLASLGAATASWASICAGSWLGRGYWPQAEGWGLLCLFLLVWGAMWASGRPLRTTGSWALNGWEQARELLAETQLRRGEVYRALRGLEEATYRIERANSELLIARQESESQRAQKEHFVATVSHELRGPLNLIVGFSRLMMMSPERYRQPLPADYYADVATIYRNSQHLADLVDDILDLSQIEAQRLPLVKEWADLTRIVGEAVATMRSLAERKGLYLIEELADDLPLTLGDRLRLRQIVLNLLTNAVRFTESGGITVRSELAQSEIIVSIKDTGQGIPPEDIPKLFREFQQAQTMSDAKTRAGRGTGLGLAISKQLVELHHGRIWVESQLHVGTAFRFAIPVLGESADQPAYGFGLSRAPALRRRQRSVIAHAAPDVVRILARYLDGYQVIGVREEQEVLALMRELHPRAILTSAEAGGALQAQVAARHDVPVISCLLPRAEQQPGWANVLAYLVKPIRPEPIEALMRQIDPGRETKVLLVDDEPDAVRLMESILTNLPRPYQIAKAYSGEQALDVLQHMTPDVVFIDLLMPNLDGVETLERMRADPRLSAIPAVIISAQDWVGGGLTLGFPLTVRRQRPMNMTQSIKCLQALLDALDPDYLAELQSAVPPPTASAP